MTFIVVLSKYQRLTYIGFNHSAFALRNEGRLQNSAFFQKHIPRGELVDLLSKALLYLEVESHWRNDGLTTNCKNGFSLLEPHVCSVESARERTSSVEDIHMELGNSASISAHGALSPTAAIPPYTSSQPTRNDFQTPDLSAASQLATASDPAIKRKTSPIPLDGRIEKRARTTPTDMEIDTNSDCLLIHNNTPTNKLTLYTLPQ